MPIVNFVSVCVGKWNWMQRRIQWIWPTHLILNWPTFFDINFDNKRRATTSNTGYQLNSHCFTYFMFLCCKEFSSYFWSYMCVRVCGPISLHDVDLGKWHSLCFVNGLRVISILLSFNMYESWYGHRTVYTIYCTEWGHCMTLCVRASETCSFCWISLYIILFDSTHSKTNGVYERKTND